MSDQINNTDQPIDPTAEEQMDNLDALADALDAEEQSEPSSESEGPLSPLEAAEQERDALRDKNLRLTAELANVRRRADQEKADAIRYAESGFARDLLTILDDLNRTIESAGSATEVSSVTEGVRIIHEHFLKVLADHKIEPIPAVGEAFNPDVHEALLQQPSGDFESGTVMQEISTGYRMHDRVIRPARVIVSSGPAAESNAAEAGTGHPETSANQPNPTVDEEA
jgi:molecular chaperone GrpE